MPKTRDAFALRDLYDACLKDVGEYEPVQFTPDFAAANSYEDPDVIKPVVCEDTRCEDGTINVTLKKLSWNMFRFEKI